MLNSVASYEKNEHVQQANLFKRQTSAFQFFNLSSKFI